MSDARATRHRAEEIVYHSGERSLEIRYADGVTLTCPAELLRVESPSAEVQGHGPGQKKLIAGRRHVGITGIEPVGSYAIRIRFDDLHDTGIYTWDYLRKLGENHDSLWQAYLARLAEAGLSRDP